MFFSCDFTFHFKSKALKRTEFGKRPFDVIRKEIFTTVAYDTRKYNFLMGNNFEDSSCDEDTTF